MEHEKVGVTAHGDGAKYVVRDGDRSVRFSVDYFNKKIIVREPLSEMDEWLVEAQLAELDAEGGDEEAAEWLREAKQHLRNHVF